MQTDYDLQSTDAILSPDGQQITFLAPPILDADDPPTAIPTATPNPEPISTDEPNGEPTTGQAAAQNEENTGNGLEIFIAPIDDLEEAQQLTRFGTANLSGLAWSPEGDEILYVRDNTRLEGVQLNGDIQQYLPNDDTSLKREPVWSPDKTRLLYASDIASPGLLEIFALDVETETIEQLTNDAGSSTSATISPDGNQIIFISNRNGDTDLFIMEANGSSERSITPDDNGAVDQSPVFSPDGRWVAFSSTRGGETFQIFLLNVQDLSIEQVTDNAQDNLNPSFRP
jgi:TolB protein